MPLDEEQKRELIKKINEQRESLLMGKSSSSRQSKKEAKKAENTPEKQARIFSPWKTSAKIPVAESIDNQEISDSDDIKSKAEAEAEKLISVFRTELKKSVRLDWKLTLLVIAAIIGAIIIGVLIGYSASFIGSVKNN